MGKWKRAVLNERIAHERELRQADDLATEATLVASEARRDGSDSAMVARIGANDSRIAVLERQRERQEGALSTLRFIIVILSIPGLIASLVAFYNLVKP